MAILKLSLVYTEAKRHAKLIVLLKLELRAAHDLCLVQPRTAEEISKLFLAWRDYDR